jgi:hypothetical protein
MALISPFRLHDLAQSVRWGPTYRPFR